MTELTPERRKELLRLYVELKAILPNRAMYEACPDSLMRDIVNDQRRGVSPPSSLASTPGDPPPCHAGELDGLSPRHWPLRPALRCATP